MSVSTEDALKDAFRFLAFRFVVAVESLRRQQYSTPGTSQ